MLWYVNILYTIYILIYVTMINYVAYVDEFIYIMCRV